MHDNTNPGIWAYPRSRGATPIKVGPNRANQGLSPLARGNLLIRQALFVNLARAEVSKPLDGLKLNGIGTLQ